MAGAAVIAAVTNALEGREFPFVFGGDGASFAVSPDDLERAREALAATAIWVREDLDLVDAGGAGAGRGDPRAGPRRPRRPLRAVAQSVLCDVFRRRARLGGSRDEARRVRGAGGATGHAARSLRPVVPVRGNSRPRAASSFRCWWCRRKAPIRVAFRKVIEDVIASGRAQPGCRTAGAAGRAAAAMAAGGRRV